MSSPAQIAKLQAKIDVLTQRLDQLAGLVCALANRVSAMEKQEKK